MRLPAASELDAAIFLARFRVAPAGVRQARFGEVAHSVVCVWVWGKMGRPVRAAPVNGLKRRRVGDEAHWIKEVFADYPHSVVTAFDFDLLTVFNLNSGSYLGTLCIKIRLLAGIIGGEHA